MVFKYPKIGQHKDGSWWYKLVYEDKMHFKVTVGPVFGFKSQQAAKWNATRKRNKIKAKGGME